jgi:hypothetical protein
MAFTCGKDCDITGLNNVTAHSFSLTLEGQEIDVTAFGDGDFGTSAVCRSQGTVSINSYVYPSQDDIGDEITLSVDIGDTTLSVPTVLQSKNINIDAKGVAEFTTVLKINGDIT